MSMPPTHSVAHGLIAAEQCVVIRGAQKAHNAQLLDKLVDQLLRARFVKRALSQVPFDIDIEE